MLCTQNPKDTGGSKRLECDLTEEKVHTAKQAEHEPVDMCKISEQTLVNIPTFEIRCHTLNSVTIMV